MKQAVISDLDNTLALLDRDPYKEQDKLLSDKVNPQVLRLLKYYQSLGIALIFLTGRWETFYTPTEKWIKEHDLYPERIFMRPVTNYDTGTRLKEWYLENVIMQQYTPILALDDMSKICQMYREHGVDCWQVNNDPWMSDKTV